MLKRTLILIFSNFAFLEAAAVNVGEAATTTSGTTKPPNPCPSGYELFEEKGKCYKHYTTALLYKDAKFQCDRDGTSLVHIGSESDNSILINNTNGADVWMGLWCTNSSLSNCYWQDDGSTPTYNNFLRGPDISVGACVVMYGTSGKWGSLDCTHNYAPFVCEYDLRNDICGAGWKYLNDSCYKIVVQSNIHHADAQSLCYSNSGQLASIHSQEENNALAELAHATITTTRNTTTTIGAFIWIGLRRVGTTQTFEWSDGTDGDYANWFPDYPSATGYYSWGLMYSQNSTADYEGHWKDADDVLKNYALCKKPFPN